MEANGKEYPPYHRHDEDSWINRTLLGNNRSGVGFFLHYVLFPLTLMFIMMPNWLMAIWFTCTYSRGSYGNFLYMFEEYGILGGLFKMWKHIEICSWSSLAVLIGYKLWALSLMKIVPGPRVEGPPTQHGHIPVYKDNGLYCYIITIMALVPLIIIGPFIGIYPLRVYNSFGNLLATEFVLAYIFCGFLYLKGIFAPEGPDQSRSGSPLFDYYSGVELHPKVWGVDVKVFTNCRFGMTIWGVLVCLYAMTNYEQNGFVDSVWVSTILQQVYIVKFFYWEGGYMKTLDIIMDKAGFYICWGCFCIVPGLYASVSLYLVEHSTTIGTPLSILILTAGIAAIVLNYFSDLQKQKVRQTKGNCLVWGKKPLLIRASYTLETGEHRESLLLTSGFWGCTRHFNYVLELWVAFMWTIPAMFNNLMPYSYLIFLSLLLVHRTYRDEQKCSKKYKHFWDTYCDNVPYKLIPYIF